jgi:SAM-dependent methyltransferase
VTAAAWLTSHEALLPRRGAALDVACGRGRNALWLAERSFVVRAIDRDAAAIAALNDESRARGLPISAEVCDLESGECELGVNHFDVIVVTHYLHRPLFPHLVAALRPAGMLVYETFTTAQAERGKPSNPAFLLQPGELRGLVNGLEIVVEREGDFDDRFVASLIARRPAPRGPQPSLG